MKTMNLIFAVIFALCAIIALSAVIFSKALHQLPMCALSALMAVTLYNSDKTKQQQ
jgi:MFS superfamily sulfate permease-like transporter